MKPDVFRQTQTKERPRFLNGFCSAAPLPGFDLLLSGPTADGVVAIFRGSVDATSDFEDTVFATFYLHNFSEVCSFLSNFASATGNSKSSSSDLPAHFTASQPSGFGSPPVNRQTKNFRRTVFSG